jgi:hypothetical protein
MEVSMDRHQRRTGVTDAADEQVANVILEFKETVMVRTASPTESGPTWT